MSYNASDIKELEYPVSCQKRLGMYLGGKAKDDDSPGQKNVAIREIFDNSTTEAMKAKDCDLVEVTFSKDDNGKTIICVEDNGRGLPVDIDKDTGKTGIEKCLATLHAGGNFSRTDGKNGAGLNGVGGAVTNAVCERFDVEVIRKGKKYTENFSNGYIKDKMKKEKYSGTKQHGTKITFIFNDNFFDDCDHVQVDDFIDRIRYTAYLIPDLTIKVSDKTRSPEDGGGDYEFINDNGVQGLEDFISSKKSLNNTICIDTRAKYKEKVLDVDSDTPTTKEVTNVIPVEVAFRWNDGDEENLESFANTIRTQSGGVHKKALEDALVATFGKTTKKSSKVTIEKEDVLAGLDAVISINVPEPAFTSQAKERLSGKEVYDAIYSALVKEFNKTIKSMPESEKTIISTKISDNAKVRAAASIAKASKKRSLAKSSPANLPSNLKECSEVGSDYAELHICEGLSAAGTVVAARDATFQAVLPIRGKILNVMKMDFTNKKQRERFEKNAEIADITKALGAGMGQTFDLEKIRYGKVIFDADSDVDGYDINVLLLGVFYKLFRPMIEDGRVYQSLSPLFEIKYKKAGKEIVEYAADEKERMKIESRLKKEKITTYDVARNKGLGEMSADVFHDYVLNPAKRRLVKITIEDAQAAADAINLAIGDVAVDGLSAADQRKNWMIENSQVVDELGLYE